MPSYTHLQRAEPVLVAHWLLAYVSMLERDFSRLVDCRRRLNLCPLGSGAIAGATLRLDRTIAASALGFDGPTPNSMDATSDRDFAIEFTQCVATIGLHISRFAEELTLHSTAEFGFLDLPERYSTGSSAMPQKKNPDLTELIRGKAGRLQGAAITLSTIVKGLPLTYSKDLQDDKETVFGAFDALALSLAAMTGMVDTLAFRTDRMRALAASGFSTATDLADWLVREAGVPFREAHHIVGACVKRSEELGVELSALPADEAAAIHAAVTPAALAALTVEASVASRMSYGGTAPERVRQAVAAARAALEI